VFEQAPDMPIGAISTGGKINNLCCLTYFITQTDMFTQRTGRHRACFSCVAKQVSWTCLQSDQNLRDASRGTTSSNYRSISAAGARPQQQTRRPPLLSIDWTDRRTDGRTLDRLMTLTA